MKTFLEWLESKRETPESLGELFNSLDYGDFVDYLRMQLKEDPGLKFRIVAPWTSVEKARAAKALFDMYATRLNIDSFSIKATRQQYEQDVNAFESGLKWVEI